MVPDSPSRPGSKPCAVLEGVVWSEATGAGRPAGGDLEALRGLCTSGAFGLRLGSRPPGAGTVPGLWCPQRATSRP